MLEKEDLVNLLKQFSRPDTARNGLDDWHYRCRMSGQRSFMAGFRPLVALAIERHAAIQLSRIGRKKRQGHEMEKVLVQTALRSGRACIYAAPPLAMSVSTIPNVMALRNRVGRSPYSEISISTDSSGSFSERRRGIMAEKPKPCF